MTNLKNITDLPIAESSEGINLIVNDNGSAKQIPASAVGAQADWNETDETSPAFIMNKPQVSSGGAVTYTTTSGYFYYGDWETGGTQVSYNDFMSDFSNGVVRYKANNYSVGTIVGYYINSSNNNKLTVYHSGTGNPSINPIVTNYIAQ